MLFRWPAQRGGHLRVRERIAAISLLSVVAAAATLVGPTPVAQAQVSVPPIVFDQPNPKPALAGTALVSFVNPDGAGVQPRPLDSALVDPEDPVWSKDGQLLAATAAPVGGGPQKNVFIFRPDGTGIRQITGLTTPSIPCGALTKPWVIAGKAFSQDGQNLVYSIYELCKDPQGTQHSDWELVVNNVTSGQLTTIIGGGPFDADQGVGLDWSPVADTVVVPMTWVNPTTLYPATALFGGPPTANSLGTYRRITSPPGRVGFTTFDLFPTISRDGLHVAFVRYDTNAFNNVTTVELRVADMAGDNERVLQTFSQEIITHIGWSPDGSKLVFDRGTSSGLIPNIGGKGLWVLNTSDGMGLTQIVSTTAWSPSWNPIMPTVPKAPATVVALAGEASATVYWTPPSFDGGAPITGYTLTTQPAGATVIAPANATSAQITGLTDGTTYTITVASTNSAGTGLGTASNTVTPGRGQYHPVSPARILDTRDGTGGVPVARLGANSSMNAQITGQGGVPSSGVAAVVLNVTVTNTSAGSYLTVWPTGVPQPLASNLNFVGGVSVPNLVEVAVGLNGQVSVYNAYGNTDVIFDVAGYVATPTAVAGPDGLNNPVVPFRLLDTRDGTGASPAPVGPNQTITVHVTGVLGSGVPATGVSAVVLNVTATNPTGGSYLTVFPAGATQPVVSNLNFFAGQTVPNRVIVKVGTGGQVTIYNAYGTVDVVADVAGWFTDGVAATTGSRYVGVIPARILDTRDGTGGVSTPLGANASIPVTVAGHGGVPAMNAATPPSAVVLNVTVTNPTAGSYLTVWPDGAAKPLASDLNYGPGLTVPNLVVVKLGSNGMIDLYNAFGTTDVIIDVVGWYG